MAIPEAICLTKLVVRYCMGTDLSEDDPCQLDVAIAWLKGVQYITGIDGVAQTLPDEISAAVSRLPEARDRRRAEHEGG